MVRLVPMEQDVYTTWYEQSVKDYAGDKVRAGNWSAGEALERSRRDFEALLPQGLATPGVFLYSIFSDECAGPVGMIWFNAERDIPEPRAFIYDFVIYETHRRLGYASGALRALEEVVRGLGIQRIGLHVFGYNQAAIKLYEKMGFETTNINMEKRLSQENPA